MVWNNNRWFSLNMFNFYYARVYLRNGNYAYDTHAFLSILCDVQGNIAIDCFNMFV